VKEHRRSALLLAMLEDHAKRSEALQEALLAANEAPVPLVRPVTSFALSPSAHRAASGTASSSADEGGAVYSWLSAVGVCLGVAVCLWALATSGAAQAQSFGRRAKHSTHIV
jgi:hypothetical protein